MEDRGTDYLHVELAVADRALGRLAHRGERLGAQIVQRPPPLQLLAQPPGHAGQPGVVEPAELASQRVGALDQAGVAAHGPGRTIA